MTPFVIYPSTGKTQTTSCYKSWDLGCVCLWLVFLSISNCADTVYITSLLQIVCWIGRVVKSAGSLCQGCVYSLVCSLAFHSPDVFVAASPPQAAVLVLRICASSGGRQTPKKGGCVCRGCAFPLPGLRVCVNTQNSFFTFSELGLFTRQEMSVHLHYLS